MAIVFWEFTVTVTLYVSRDFSHASCMASCKHLCVLKVTWKYDFLKFSKIKVTVWGAVCKKIIYNKFVTFFAYLEIIKTAPVESASKN